MARAMKDSGVAWIGEIPEEWDIAKVSYFYDVQLGKMLQTDKTSDMDSLESYLCAVNLGGNQLKLSPLRQMWFSADDKDKYAVKQGDLLVVEGGDVASCDIIRQEISNIYIQNALHRVRSKGKSSVDFLRYLLLWAKASGYIDLICNKATIAHFTKDKLGAMPFVFPKSNTQSHIAAFIDSRCADIDRVIASTQSTIEEYKKLKQSIITEAVTHGVRGPRKMKDSGVEWIGEIPEEWELVKGKGLFVEADIRSTDGSEELLTVSGNLYQIFTYVKNKEQEFGDQEHMVSGMLLYARTDEQIQPDGDYLMSGNKISVKTLDLNCEFSEMAGQLNGIAENYFSNA